MSRALPWYKHCPRDFAAETRGWPLSARAVYRELLDAAWEMQDGLPAGVGDLQRLAAASRREWAEGWPYCEPRFPVGEDGRRHSAFIEATRRQATEVSRQRALAGLIGAQKRWQLPGNGVAVDSGSYSNSHPAGIANTCTSTSEIKHPDSGASSPRKRARPASPEGPRARPDEIDESNPEVQRRRALAEARR
ncbi:MAG: DUF1376 domain-containing protein [Steroidobacteraceae bacterium]